MAAAVTKRNHLPVISKNKPFKILLYLVSGIISVGNVVLFILIFPFRILKLFFLPFFVFLGVAALAGGEGETRLPASDVHVSWLPWLLSFACFSASSYLYLFSCLAFVDHCWRGLEASRE